MSAGAGVVWLLDLTIAGRVNRYATEPVTVNGESYSSGLDRGIAVATAAARGTSVISTVLSLVDACPEGVPGGWPAVLLGVGFAGATAVLRRWWPSRGEQPREMLRGQVEEPAYEEPNELKFTLQQDLIGGSGGLLNPRGALDDSTWPNAPIIIGTYERDESVTGASYPLVFGHPGDMFGVTLQRPAVPAPLAQKRILAGGDGSQTHLAVADGRYPIQATETRAWDRSTDPNDHEIRPLILETDRLGQPIYVTDFFGSSLTAEAGRPYFSGWTRETSQGGILRDDESGPLQGLGEIIGWILDKIPTVDVVDIDPRLNAWEIDTYINDPEADGWAWIAGDLLGSLADFRLVAIPGGVAVRLVDWLAVPAPARYLLDIDERAGWPVGGMVMSSVAAVRNEVTVEYRPDPSGGYLERVIVTAEADPADARVHPDPRCRASQASGWGVQSHTISTSHVWHTPTALLAARQHVARHAYPVVRVSYAVPATADLERHVQVGDELTLQHSDRSLFGRLAHIEQITVGTTQVRVDLTITTNPAAAGRASLG